MYFGRQSLALLLLSALSAVALAADTVSIPSIPRAISLRDFEGMRPQPAIAGSLGHIDKFIQQTPSDGQPATLRTEAWFGYTHSALYVVFVCHDPNPGQLHAHLTRREQMLDDDWVRIIIDPFEDKRHGFLFAVNPLGIQADALWTESSSATADYSYDTVWSSEGHLTPEGYIVLMSIPFRSLRFRSDVSTWGIVFQRNIPQRSETDYWPRVSSRVSGTLSQEGIGDGIAQVSPSHNFQVNPYTVLRALHGLDTRDPLNPYFTNKELQGRVGADAKYVIKDRLVLDATVNPDFSQVESDEPQQTVNQRFEVYFPEKRPFFLENANYFQTPINLVFTRRILDPEWGARLTGKLGGTNIGFFATDDRGPGEIVPNYNPVFGQRAQVVIARVSQDIWKQSSIGAIFTQRTFAGGFNRLGGIDTRLRLNQHWTVDGQFVVSSTETPDGRYYAGPAGKFDVSRFGRQLAVSLQYEDYSPGFISQLGYIRRTDYRHITGQFDYRFRPEGKHLIDHGPELESEYGWNHSNDRVWMHQQFEYVFDFTRKTQVFPLLGVNSDTAYPGEVPNLTYRRTFTQNFIGGLIQSSPVPQLTLNLLYTYGGNPNWTPAPGVVPSLFSEDWFQGTVTVQPVRALTIANSYLLDRNFTRPDGEFAYESQILRTNWNYQFTRTMSVRTIIQYNNVLANPAVSSLERTKNVNADLLFTYLLHPGTAIYVGYNSNVENLNRALCMRQPNGQCDLAQAPLAPTNDYTNTGRLIFIKLAYLLRF
jgi:hypothetical protein